MGLDPELPLCCSRFPSSPVSQQGRAGRWALRWTTFYDRSGEIWVGAGSTSFALEKPQAQGLGELPAYGLAELTARSPEDCLSLAPWPACWT